MATRFLTRRATAVSAVRRVHGSQSRGTSIFVTGGIGDVIALSCFLELPADLETIYYATRKRDDVQAYLSALCPITTKHVSVWDDWTDNRWGWYSLPEFIRHARSHRDALATTEDWSISSVFPKEIPFRGTPWTERVSQIDLSQFALPDEYLLLCPYSTDKRDRRRDFTEQELHDVLEMSNHWNLPVVYQYEGADLHPMPPWVIDLSNRMTSVWDMIAIAAKASAYIGIDSCQSQVVTKHLPADRLVIKSTNHAHYYQHLRWYCAPHTSFEFVSQGIGGRP